MFYIKLDKNMDLVVTARDPIYRGDNLCRKIIYLIPFTVGDIDVISSYVYLNYIRPDGVADIVTLRRLDEKYNESYYQYVMPVDCKLSKYAGEVYTWLQFFSGSASNPITAKSSECVIRVEESRSMDAYLCDHQATAIYQMQKQVDDMNSGKADNIVFDQSDSTIQLVANGEPIGSKITISASQTGVSVTNAELVDGELIISFSDGTTKNVGTVVDDAGMVYVPHLSERKILTWTIESDAGEIPDAVDLNPHDEWGSVDESEIETEYIWETIV